MQTYSCWKTFRMKNLNIRNSKKHLKRSTNNNSYVLMSYRKTLKLMRTKYKKKLKNNKPFKLLFKIQKTQESLKKNKRSKYR